MRRSYVIMVAALGILPATLRAEEPAAKGRFAGGKPGTLAVYATEGNHGLKDETAPRSLEGTLTVLCWTEGSLTRLVTVFNCKQEGVVFGCPIAMFRWDDQVGLAREPGVAFAYGATFVNNTAWPPQLRSGPIATKDLLARVLAIDTPMTANLKVEVAAGKEGKGWSWRESLARPSEEQMLPPGKSRLIDWSGDYAVDGDGLVESADQRYVLQVSTQGNMEIVVRTKLTRKSIRTLSAAEQSRWSAELAELSRVNKGWMQEREATIKLLEALEKRAGELLFGPTIAPMKAQAVWEKTRIDEQKSRQEAAKKKAESAGS